MFNETKKTPMTYREAASVLVEMVAALRVEGYNRQSWYDAVSIACGVLLVDDVLKGGEEPSEED